MVNYLRNMIMNCVDEGPTPLSFMAESAGATVKLTKSGSPTVDGLQYRMGTSGGWTPYTIDTILTLTNVGDVVQFQNTLEELSNSTSNYVKFVFSGQIAATGNIMSMLNYIDECKSYCFINLFNSCNSLTTAPELLATTLANYCYKSMFYGCSSLTVAPELPATNLANYCYYSMFSDCTSLVNAPELPATTLVTRCYWNMFRGCSSLVNAPELPATTLANYCYNNMFEDCSSLTSAPTLPATTLADHCYASMFYNCTNLTSAPTLPATNLANYCYINMFYNCTSLTSAPTLPATNLADSCYESMFFGCTSLTSAPTLPATKLARYCYSNMFRGCSSLVNAPELPATNLILYCYASMFYNCTSLVNAPELPATNLANYCYNNMFNGCTKLKYIKVNFSSWTANTTSNWVKGVSSTGEFDAPSNLPIIFGDSNIPTGWTLTNVSPGIEAEDQSMEFSTLVERIGNIKYKVFPLDSIMTFALAEDTTLPAGLELNTSTGEIKGISTASEGVYETKIKLSAPDCEDVIITLTITIAAVAFVTTPHNLTSNTSDSRYEVSQSSNLETTKRLAWNAMDGSLDEEYGCSHTNIDSNQWWKIKFNNGPVQVTKLTWTNRTGGLGTYLKNPYKIQGSNNDSTWTTVYTIEDMVSTSEAVKTWEISNTTKYQYWRILQEGYSYLIIGEIEFEYSL